MPASGLPPSAYGLALPAFVAAKSSRRNSQPPKALRFTKVFRGYVFLLNLQQLHVEDQIRIRRDGATRSSFGPVTERRRNTQLAFAAALHSRSSFFPSLDDLAV